MAADYIREKLNNKLFPPYRRNVNKKLRVLASKDNQQDAGFTMLEMIVVAIMVGILAAIAAPGWLGFVNRQRLNKGNDAVLSALQQAQREAKRSRVDYSVSFRTNDEDVPQFAVYPSSGSPLWQTLGEGEIALLTNLTDTNQTDTDGALDLNYLDEDSEKTIEFDYMGSLPNAKFGGEEDDEETPGLKIAVVTRKTGTDASLEDQKRCVIVKTLLGTMITERDDKCD